MDDLQYRYLLFQLARYEGCTLPRCQDVEESSGSNSSYRGPQPFAVTQDGPITAIEDDLRRLAGDLQILLPEFRRLHPVRQRVLLHIAFKLGVSGLLALHRFIAAVQAGDWTLAAGEILLSPWGTQDPARAAVLAEMIRACRDEQIGDTHGRSA